MNANDLWLVSDWIEAGYSLRLTQVLIHFLWQGCAIAIVYAAVVRLSRKATANTRYVAGVVALLSMVACLPVTLLVLPSPGKVAADEAAQPPAVAVPRTPSPAGAGVGAALVDTDTQDPALAAPATNRAESEPPASPSATATSASDGVAVEFFGRDRVTGFLTSSAPYASGLYLCGVVAMLLRVALGLGGGRRLRFACTPLADGPILELIRDHTQRLGMRFFPLIAYCQRISVPVVVGVLRPVILLPMSVASGLTSRQLEAVLLHELAHIRRFDPALNVLQRLIEAMLFFHPAVWWLSRRTSAEREEACDDLVLRSNCGRIEYAEALVRMAELSTATDNRDVLGGAALAATGNNSSHLKRRVLRLLGRDDRAAIRLTTAGVVISMCLILSVLLTPIAWRSAISAEAAPERTAAEAPGDQEHQPLSMSAEEFGRLPLEEQRALLVRVFERRLEHAKNLYYDTEQIVTAHLSHDGEPGEPSGDSPGQRRSFRHWQLGDSFRSDIDEFRHPRDTEPWTSRSMAADVEKGLGRDTTISRNEKIPTRGFVRYPFEPVSLNRYRSWTTDRTNPEEYGGMQLGGYPLFSYLLERPDEFVIEAVLGSDKVRLTVPWKSGSVDNPASKRVYLLDPRKEFLPIRYDARYESPPEDTSRWRTEKFVVEESRLVDDVWMPTKLTETGFESLFPDTVAVWNTRVLRIEHGTVTPDDLMLPFAEGMEVIDAVQSIRYVADAQGNPAGPVKLAPGWKSEPPEGCPERHDSDPPVAGWSSRLSAADLEMLRRDKEDKETSRKHLEAALHVLQARPSAALAERIEAGLEVLRTYKIGANETTWAAAIRELIQIGKPAVAKLTEELDGAERDETLRALGFVLRGIDDPRAVPALIRAIPSTLRPSRSDYGLLLHDAPELAEFMDEYDHDSRPGHATGRFSYGRPVREIMSALRKITDKKLGWKELRFVSLSGGAEQQRIKQKLFLDLARRWANWWSKNRHTYVENEADAQLERTTESLDQYSKSISTASDQPPRSGFPRGENVTEGGGAQNNSMKSFVDWPASGFLDLDSGRLPSPAKALVEESTADQPSEALLAWADREGVDLINVEFDLPGSDKSLLAFKPLAMKVWRIENSRFANIQKELGESEEFELPAPWEGPLAPIDQQTGEYDEKSTASFLFITREGTCGAIQIQSPVSRKLVPGTATHVGGGVHYKFIFEANLNE